MGKEARAFADFLAAGGQRYWQLLPLGPTGYGDSPYQSFSTFAGNPYLIDLDSLAEEGLLTEPEYAGERTRSGWISAFSTESVTPC
jgi:4-alpha-glucanotransferase